MPWIKAIDLCDLPDGSSKPVRIGTRWLAVFATQGEYFAIDNECPHRGAPLWEGQLEGTTVICPWHPGRFDLRTGQPLSPPPKRPIACYPVRVEGDALYVEVPAEEVPAEGVTA
jgi:nitrite reductase/ring-hydroxylating ferredoxin subunit